MDVATEQSDSKDGVSGGRQRTTLPAINGKRTLPDYGALSARTICPTGKYLFTAGDEPSARIGRGGRRMTSVDFQVVAMYTDLSRRDIGYLQSIARVYDVTQMRELIQCRLNHMGKKRRCLDVTRQEDYKVYGGYLQKKYGERMPDLMPMMYDNPRPPKAWPRVNEYPDVRNIPRFSNRLSRDTRRASIGSQPRSSIQEDSTQKVSTAAVRGSEVPDAKAVRNASIRKGRAAATKAEQKAAEGKVGRRSEPGAPGGTIGGVGVAGTKRSSKPTPGQQKSVRGKDAEGGAVGVSSEESAEVKLGERGAAARSKDTAAGKPGAGGKGGKSVPKEDGGEESVDYVDMFSTPADDEETSLELAEGKTKGGKGGVGKKAALPGDEVDAEGRYAGEKFDTPTKSETPEIAKSMSLDDVEGIFTPEYDESTGQLPRGGKGHAAGVGGAEVKDDSLLEDEDVNDHPAESRHPDQPADEMDEAAMKRLEDEKPDAELAPLFMFEDGDEKVQVFPAVVSSLVDLEALDTEERTAAKSSADNELSKTGTNAGEKGSTSKKGDSSHVSKKGGSSSRSKKGDSSHVAGEADSDHSSHDAGEGGSTHGSKEGDPSHVSKKGGSSRRSKKGDSSHVSGEADSDHSSHDGGEGGSPHGSKEGDSSHVSKKGGSSSRSKKGGDSSHVSREGDPDHSHDVGEGGSSHGSRDGSSPHGSKEGDSSNVAKKGGSSRRSKKGDSSHVSREGDPDHSSHDAGEGGSFHGSIEGDASRVSGKGGSSRRSKKGGDPSHVAGEGESDHSSHDAGEGGSTHGSKEGDPSHVSKKGGSSRRSKKGDSSDVAGEGESDHSSHGPREGGSPHGSTEGGSPHGSKEGDPSHVSKKGGSSRRSKKGDSSHVAGEGESDHSSHGPREGDSPHGSTEGGSPHGSKEGDPSHVSKKGGSSRRSKKGGDSSHVAGEADSDHSSHDAGERGSPHGSEEGDSSRVSKKGGSSRGSKKGGSSRVSRDGEQTDTSDTRELTTSGDEEDDDDMDYDAPSCIF